MVIVSGLLVPIQTKPALPRLLAGRPAAYTGVPGAVVRRVRMDAVPEVRSLSPDESGRCEPRPRAQELPQEDDRVANEQIWAPWRMAYIRQEDQAQAAPAGLALLPGADPECFLCQAVADTADRRRYVVARTGHSICLLNRYPYNNGHLLVAPRRHLARLDELDSDELLDLGRMLARMIAALEQTLQAQGFNVGLNLGRVAGAGLPGHVHWHVVPRWQGDTSFMPLLASVNVIPQSLDALWEVLSTFVARPTHLQ